MCIFEVAVTITVKVLSSSIDEFIGDIYRIIRLDLHGNLDLLQMCIHGGIYTNDGTAYDGPILQFHSDNFSV